MPSKRLLLLVVLISSFACNFVTRTVAGYRRLPAATPTAQPSPTAEVYIPPGCESRGLATVPAPTELAVPTPALDANPPVDPQLQLQIFEEAAKTISDVYVYPDFNGKDWNAIVAAYRAKVMAGLSTEAFYTEMQNMVADLGDDHSRFDSPVDVAQSQAELSDTSQYVGIGVGIDPEVDKGRLNIVGVFPGSPAEHSGLKVHDSLLAVDGLPLVQAGRVYGYRIRGPECSVADLTVQSPGQAPRHVLVLRHRIDGDIPVDARLVTTTDGSRIGYIMLPSFFDEKIPGEVAAALEHFGKLDGLIIDNRLNTGGSSDVVEPVLSYFTHGTLGTFRSRTSARPLTIQASPIANSQTVPLVVLVGLDTASFGEIFAGVLQDSGRAKVVGETTLGNVEILHGYDFKDGSRLWIAQERFDPAISHANWEATGIVPNVQAFADWDTFTWETDPAVNAALRLLGHR